MENEQNNAGTMATAGQAGQSTPEPTFTKDQVNELMQKRIERSHSAFYQRYGVKDLAELDNLFGQASSYGPLKEQFDGLTKTNGELTAENDKLKNQISELSKKYAFKSANINPDKYGDVEAYFKGKNLEINEENLNSEVKAHKDWIAQLSNVMPIGSESVPNNDIDERALASKYFGVDLTKRRN